MPAIARSNEEVVQSEDRGEMEKHWAIKLSLVRHGMKELVGKEKENKEQVATTREVRLTSN
jgi:hypothetical protein